MEADPRLEKARKNPEKRLNYLTAPYPHQRYQDGDGNYHYGSLFVVDEGALGDGPTLVFAGDFDKEVANNIEKVLTSTVELGYQSSLFPGDKGEKLYGKHSKILESRVKPIEEFYSGKKPGERMGLEIGQLASHGLLQDMKFRKKFTESFPYVDYMAKDSAYPSVRVEDGKGKKVSDFDGEYFLKWKVDKKSKRVRVEGVYVAPKKGISERWYQTKLFSDENLAELSKQYVKNKQNGNRNAAIAKLIAIANYTKDLIDGERQYQPISR